MEEVHEVEAEEWGHVAVVLCANCGAAVDSVGGVVAILMAWSST